MKRKAKSKPTCSKPPVDLTGKRFGKWTVLKYAGEKDASLQGMEV